MDLFKRAKTIRLRSYKDKYLIAEDDQESVCQHRDGTTNNALWTVELVQGRDLLRIKSCYGRYLTASNIPFLPGVTGKKVIQTLTSKFDPATEWEPLRDGMQVRLRTLWGDFLRPNGGLPPWRNSVTHDIPHWHKSYNKILWDVEVIETFPVLRRTRSNSAFFRSRSSVSFYNANEQHNSQLRSPGIKIFDFGLFKIASPARWQSSSEDAAPILV